MTILINLLKKLHDFKELLWQLVSRDIKLRYRRSFLGYLWSILNPLLTMIVMLLVFSSFFADKKGGSIPNFAVYLITGVTFFNFLTESTNSAMQSVIGNASLLKKVYVPKYIFTLSKVMSSLVNLLFSMAALIIIMIIEGIPFTFYLLLVPFVMLQLFVFCIGLGLFLAQLVVFFRDMQYIYSVITMAWMYMTPIFYKAEDITGIVGEIIRTVNPMYFYITQFRTLIYGPIMPEFTSYMPDITYVLYGCGFALFFLIFGCVTFYKAQDKFILYV